MCRVASKRAISLLLGVIGIGLPAGAQPSPTEAALQDAGMIDVLEAHLHNQLMQATDESVRNALIDRLAEMYTGALRVQTDRTPERAALSDRAWRLADLAGDQRAVELRLTLLLDDYLPIERTAELHELGLLSEADRAATVETLRVLHTRFLQMARAAVVGAATAERRSRSSEDEGLYEQTRTAYRSRSLANYYAAWSGLTLAVLEERVAPVDVSRAFGWLLGSAGELPKLDDVSPSALELEHVARSVIGVARVRAISGDWILAEQWLKLLTDSDVVTPDIRRQAIGRLLRIKADQREWTEAFVLCGALRDGESDEVPLSTPDARYLALRTLSAIRNATRGRGAPEPLARMALGDLIRRGEIGHVLDLRARFGTVGLLGDGFVGRYADALDRLELAQDAGTPGLYTDAASRLGDAASADDADRFPLQRDDAWLKAAFCEIRAGRPRKALETVRLVLDSDPAAAAAEEARWLLVVALDETADARLAEQLADAVRDYLARYPGTDRANRLLVRHAGSDMLEPAEVAEGLRGVGETDPVVLSARRVLARLVYRVWTDSRRTDTQARNELLNLIDWIWARETTGPNPAQPRERIDIARIALDAALGASPQDIGRAEQALHIAERALLDDPTLGRFADELALRSVELYAASGRLAQAAQHADALRRSANPLGVTADRLLLAAIFEHLTARPEDQDATQLGVRIGARLSGDLIPPAPETLTPEASRVIDRVWRLAAGLSESADDPEMLGLALRLARVVLERGSPTAQGLRELAELANRAGDAPTELGAWSTLLGASRDTEPVWWEARYQTLRLLKDADPGAARRAFDQHKVLHPLPGLLPWTTLIDGLFPFEPDAQSGVTP